MIDTVQENQRSRSLVLQNKCWQRSQCAISSNSLSCVSSLDSTWSNLNSPSSTLECQSKNSWKSRSLIKSSKMTSETPQPTRSSASVGSLFTAIASTRSLLVSSKRPSVASLSFKKCKPKWRGSTFATLAPPISRCKELMTLRGKWCSSKIVTSVHLRSLSMTLHSLICHFSTHSSPMVHKIFGVEWSNSMALLC